MCQFVNAELTKNVLNRRHAINFNFGYDLPDVSRKLWSNNPVAKAVLDGWHINGNGSIFAGTPYTVGCSATGQPSQYWTGTPTAYLPFRCQMGSNIFLTGGSAAFGDGRSALAGSAERGELHAAGGELAGHRQYAADPVLRSLVVELDLSLAKMTRIAEGKMLELRIETFNTLQPLQPEQPEYFADSEFR